MAAEWKKILIEGDEGASNFLDLTDTPASYADQGGKGVRVNAGSDALEFYTLVDTDEKVKAASGDTAGYLDAKVDDSTIEVATNALQVKDAGITATQLATDAVETLKIKDLNVTTGKIAADAITAEKVADDAIGSEHIEALSADLDFAGNEAKDMVLMNSAENPATAVLGKVYFKTGDTHPYICTSI